AQTAALADEYSAQWGLGMIGARLAHERGWTGRGVTVGVVDSGIIAGHPDLEPHVTPESFSGHTLGPSDGDAVGHGTHVAGTIAALANGVGMVGVAPGVRVTSMQLSGPDGEIDEARLDSIAASAISYGLDLGIEFF